MQYQLPSPISANYSYEALRIENMRYDGTQYTADVFGVTQNQCVPFIVANQSGSILRIAECVITDVEIDAVLAARPEITTRTEAAITSAMQRLYALIQS